MALITIYFGARLKLKQKFPPLPADIFLSKFNKGIKKLWECFSPGVFLIWFYLSISLVLAAMAFFVKSVFNECGNWSYLIILILLLASITIRKFLKEN